ncbi:ThuA domain-containing protein [Cnuibacter sp. UC19_7]|uniref:ThuA domain-containing protein n=1 Tax=Cnuibacter sp. UC19_7 TaxID=3350166 RepID=UPI00366B935E
MIAAAEGSGRALLLCGAGRYADPWHPFDVTAGRLAELLCDEGLSVEVSGEVDERMAALVDSDDVDLLVLDIGDPALAGRTDPAAEARGRAGLLAHLHRGRPLLAMHVSSTSLRGVPEWEEILGAVWVRGQTFHPEYGTGRVLVHGDRHGIVAGLDDFDVVDELYTDLRLRPDVVAVASHRYAGREHPLVWPRVYGDARIVYDALGHDAASFDAPAHREILSRAVRWLLDSPR